MQALAGITPTLLHEIDQAYTIPTLDELHFAEKTGFDFGKCLQIKRVSSG